MDLWHNACVPNIYLKTTIQSKKTEAKNKILKVIANNVFPTESHCHALSILPHAVTYLAIQLLLSQAPNI